MTGGSSSFTISSANITGKVWLSELHLVFYPKSISSPFGDFVNYWIIWFNPFIFVWEADDISFPDSIFFIRSIIPYAIWAPTLTFKSWVLS